MGRKNYLKGSKLTDSKIISYNTEGFGSGIIKDNPATKIPDNSLADGFNIVNYPNETQGRLGCRRYSNLEIPPLTGRTGLVGQKNGYIITCTQNLFTEYDVGNYWVWPGTETVHEEIIRYINGYNVEVAEAGTIPQTTQCYMRGKHNLWSYHSVLRKWLYIFGNEFWITDVNQSEWVYVYTISYDKPFNAVSWAQEFDNWSWVVFNSNGWFTVSYYWFQPFAWKRNIPIPNTVVAEIPPTALTNYCYGYIYSAARLTEQGNFIDRFYSSRIEVETGTNSWDENMQDWADVNTAQPIDAANGRIIYNLTVPIINNTDPQQYQWHMTHYPIYRTKDKINKYQSGQIDSVLNPPQTYIWIKDLRIAAAFLARKYNGHVLARYGEFEIADIGSVIEWEDGSRDTIIDYVKEDEVIIAHVMYYEQDTGYMAAAIGNGRVIRAEQNGRVVSRVTTSIGDYFYSTDVGKHITWSNGYRSVITEYVNASTVLVHDDQDKIEQGLTIDPKYRNFYDTTEDSVLDSRLLNGTICKCRFMEPMPNVNDGIYAPGFIITARRGEKEIYFCSLETYYEYFAGFYYRGYQFSTKITDNIHKLWKFPNKFVAFCSNCKTWHGPTNTSELVSLPDIDISFPVLSGIDVLDATIGCFDWGSIQEIDNGMIIMLTAEPSGVGLRRFNAFQYGPNELEIPKTGMTTISKDVNNLQKATASIYDGLMGYIVWGRNK